MYVDFPAESIKWSMGVIMKSRQTKAKLGNIARKTGDIPHAIVLAYLPLFTYQDQGYCRSSFVGR